MSKDATNSHPVFVDSWWGGRFLNDNWKADDWRSGAFTETSPTAWAERRLKCCFYDAARSSLEEEEMSFRLVSAKLRSFRWRIPRAELTLWTIWDSLSGFCSNAAARQSFLQFSESSVKREFIKTPSTAEFTHTVSLSPLQSRGQSDLFKDRPYKFQIQRA